MSSTLPPSGKGRYVRSAYPGHLPMVKSLKSKAGKWVVVYKGSSVSAAARLAGGINSGRLIAFRDGIYEAKQIGFNVHARYMGERVGRGKK